MGKCRIIAASFLLLAGELAFSGSAGAQGANARGLARTVDSALAGAAQAAGETDPRLANFQSAVARMRLRVRLIEEALARRDEEFFLLVDQGSSDLGWLRVAWARAGVKNAATTAGLRLAAESYRLLRSHFGREGFRHRQGGPLNEAERRHFLRIQQAQRRFADSLRSLRERALRRDDPTTVAELDRFRGEAEHISWAPLELEAYINALIAGGEMRGEWEANAPYIRDDAPEELAAADERVQDLYVESDIGHVFTIDLGPGAWSAMDEEAELPADPRPAAAAIQVYQLAEGAEAAPVEVAAGPELPAPSLAAADEEGDTDEAEEAESLADPEGLEEATAELAESEILEEEDLPAEKAAAEAAPGSDEAEAKPQEAAAASDVPAIPPPSQEDRRPQ